MKYRWTWLDTALVFVVFFLILPGMYRCVRRPGFSDPESSEPGIQADAPEEESVAVVAASPEPAAVTVTTVSEAWAPAPEWESETEKLARVQAQADEMRRYAEKAEPDDPFALTEEEIQAFEQAAPAVW